MNDQAIAGDSVAGDGQSLRSTGPAAHTAGQTRVSVVRLDAQRPGLTGALQDYPDKKTGELALLRPLLADCQDRGGLRTLDALHAPKKQPPRS